MATASVLPITVILSDPLPQSLAIEGQNLLVQVAPLVAIEWHVPMRNMSCCAVTGQGAGIAAVALKSNVALDEIDLTRVHQELDRQGVRYV